MTDTSKLEKQFKNMLKDLKQPQEGLSYVCVQNSASNKKKKDQKSRLVKIMDQEGNEHQIENGFLIYEDDSSVFVNDKYVGCDCVDKTNNASQSQVSYKKYLNELLHIFTREQLRCELKWPIVVNEPIVVDDNDQIINPILLYEVISDLFEKEQQFETLELGIVKYELGVAYSITGAPYEVNVTRDLTGSFKTEPKIELKVFTLSEFKKSEGKEDFDEFMKKVDEMFKDLTNFKSHPYCHCIEIQMNLIHVPDAKTKIKQKFDIGITIENLIVHSRSNFINDTTLGSIADLNSLPLQLEQVKGTPMADQLFFAGLLTLSEFYYESIGDTRNYSAYEIYRQTLEDGDQRTNIDCIIRQRDLLKYLAGSQLSALAESLYEKFIIRANLVISAVCLIGTPNVPAATYIAALALISGIQPGYCMVIDTNHAAFQTVQAVQIRGALRDIDSIPDPLRHEAVVDARENFAGDYETIIMKYENEDQKQDFYSWESKFKISNQLQKYLETKGYKVIVDKQLDMRQQINNQLLLLRTVGGIDAENMQSRVQLLKEIQLIASDIDNEAKGLINVETVARTVQNDRENALRERNAKVLASYREKQQILKDLQVQFKELYKLQKSYPHVQDLPIKKYQPKGPSGYFQNGKQVKIIGKDKDAAQLSVYQHKINQLIVRNNHLKIENQALMEQFQSRDSIHHRSRNYDPSTDQALQLQLNQDFQMMEEQFNTLYAQKLIELKQILISNNYK